MNGSQLDDEGSVKPSEQRGWATPDEAEIRAKGSWAATASEGLIPAELGGSRSYEEPERGLEPLTYRLQGADEEPPESPKAPGNAGDLQDEFRGEYGEL